MLPRLQDLLETGQFLVRIEGAACHAARFREVPELFGPGLAGLVRVGDEYSAVITHAADLVRFPAEGKQVEVLCDIDPDLPATAYLDPLRLSQLLTNLAGNPVKFTKAGDAEVELALSVIS